jgi:hypothetical protein
MTSALELMRAAPTSTDNQIIALVRTSMLRQPEGKRHLWLREMDLALDGYGGETSKRSINRIREVIRGISAGLGIG